MTPDAQEQITAYLAELSAHLEAGLARRQRILDEVRGHLEDAVDAGTPVAEALAAFGPPEEVAARFGPDMVGRVDGLFHRAYTRLDRSLADHPIGTACAMGAAGGGALLLRHLASGEGLPAAAQQAYALVGVALLGAFLARAWLVRCHPADSHRARVGALASAHPYLAALTSPLAWMGAALSIAMVSVDSRLPTSVALFMAGATAAFSWISIALSPGTRVGRWLLSFPTSRQMTVAFGPLALVGLAAMGDEVVWLASTAALLLLRHVALTAAATVFERGSPAGDRRARFEARHPALAWTSLALAAFAPIAVEDPRGVGAALVVLAGFRLQSRSDARRRIEAGGR